MTPPFTSIISESIVLIPAGTDDRINNIPVTVVNILIKPIGVGLDQLDHALSMSNALIKNAPPIGFIKMFTTVTGILLILSSVPAGISTIDSKIIETNGGVIESMSNQIAIGQFVGGSLPILWIGLGAIFAGILLSNWIGGILRQISDILRIIVLISLYPIIAQFTNIMIFDESSFTLIPPLLGGLAVTLVSATILFKKYRKQKDQEMVSD